MVQMLIFLKTIFLEVRKNIFEFDWYSDFNAKHQQEIWAVKYIQTLWIELLLISQNGSKTIIRDIVQYFCVKYIYDEVEPINNKNDGHVIDIYMKKTT